MTEREKMLQGLPYCPCDEELRSISNHGKELIKNITISQQRKMKIEARY